MQAHPRRRLQVHPSVSATGGKLGAELAAEKQPAPLKVGGIRRDYARGAVVDRWGRDEEQVRRQLVRAAEIADAIASCIAATPELERGITLGGRPA